MASVFNCAYITQFELLAIRQCKPASPHTGGHTTSFLTIGNHPTSPAFHASSKRQAIKCLLPRQLDNDAPLNKTTSERLNQMPRDTPQGLTEVLRVPRLEEYPFHVIGWILPSQRKFRVHGALV